MWWWVLVGVLVVGVVWLVWEARGAPFDDGLLGLDEVERRRGRRPGGEG